MFRGRVPELELFSAFLRELYDTDVLLFFLHARNTIRLMQPVEVCACTENAHTHIHTQAVRFAATPLPSLPYPPFPPPSPPISPCPAPLTLPLGSCLLQPTCATLQLCLADCFP